jgi:hypothetical protein
MASACVEADLPAGRVSVVLGAQWGDEGKGKIIDLLSAMADYVCRCQVGMSWRAPETHSTHTRALARMYTRVHVW